jgi:glycosyltransferase involved in cell wall biosynthesis
MRIAFYHAMLPGGRPGKEGGVTYVVHRLANTLVRRGHQLTLFSFDPAPSDALYRHRQLPLRRLGKPRAGRLTLAPLMLSALDLREYDVMHAHGDDHAVFRRPLPWVRTFHGSARRELESAVRLRRRLSQLVQIPLESLSARLADVAVGVSEDTVAKIAGIDAVIPCGVDLDLFRPGRQPRSPHPSILFVGGVLGRKRGDLLLDVFQRLIRPAIPEAELWMVCDPETPVEGVRWLGNVSTERLVELYQQAWVFCLPSSYEGFGVPYIEAMACGTPVVASPNPGAREILDGGRFGVIADDAKLHEALLRMLQDEASRRCLSQAGMERASAYSWDHVASLYEGIYVRAQGKTANGRKGNLSR